MTTKNDEKGQIINELSEKNISPIDGRAMQAQLNAMQTKIDAMYEIIMQKSAEATIGGYISEVQARKLLKVSKTTLYKMRRSGRLGATTFSGKAIHYKLSEIEELMKINENK